MSTSGGKSGGAISIGGSGVSQLGGAIATLDSDGNIRNYLDDSAGNMVADGLVTAFGFKSDGYMVWAVETVTSDTQLFGDEGVVLVDASAGNVAITLSSGVWGGQVVLVKKIDDSANTVTINPPSGQTIDGSADLVLSEQWASVLLQAWNEDYYVLLQGTQ